MKEYFFYMDLSYKQCLGYYYGHYTSVQVLEDGGKTIRFPAGTPTPVYFFNWHKGTLSPYFG